MNEFTILPDDPKLTAYALGELEGEERAAVEAWLSTHPEARAAVEEIRATAARLETAFANETMEPAVSVTAKPAVSVDPYRRTKKSTLLRFPQIYYVIGGLAAAGFAVVLALREQPPQPAVRQFEMTLKTPDAPSPDPAGNVAVALPALPEAPSGGADINAISEPAAAGADVGKLSTPLSSPAPNAPLAPPFSAVNKSVPSPSLTFDGKINLPPAPLAAASAAELLASKQARTRVAAEAHGRTAPTGVRGAVDKNKQQYIAKEVRRVNLTSSGPEVASSDPEGVVKLDAFAVAATAPESGYKANTTLAGSRLANWGVGSPAGFPTSRQASSTESYDYRRESDFLTAAENPLSTFSIDVDTASYANVRRMIEHGTWPPADAVRIEEMLNYFPYSYAGPSPENAGAPFTASMEVAEAPWAPSHRLVRIGLKGREVSTSQRGAANLVFLLDVSGSMNAPNKLPLVKESLRLLLGRLRSDDHVAIVTYAGASGLALPSTPISRSREIGEAIDELSPGGSTNGAMGIQLAYDIAKANFVSGGINRVVLCTDGDFNVGVTSTGELVRLITEKAKSGVFLTALGFGMGNYKDATLQQLADAGNGNYGYIDKRREAEKLLVEQVTGTLVTIAKDVKIQVEFNPAKVASYRLIGYEKRQLKKEDFNNDAVDAGEIGAGHAITALYEIVPVGVNDVGQNEANGLAAVDELKYQKRGALTANAPAQIAEHKTRKARSGNDNNATISSELLTLKVRYKEPTGEVSKKLEFPLVDGGHSFGQASGDFKFASAVAAFGMILRESAYKGAVTFADVTQWVETAESPDPGGYRVEFVALVRQAKELLSER